MAEIDSLSRQGGKREAQYFEQLGVRADISSLGQNERYDQFVKANPNAAGWTYSLEDFARLGVHDISVINPPWKPGGAARAMVFLMMPVDSK